MTLHHKLPAFAEEFRNFAYICRFDRDSRKIGKETLFLSNLDPLEEYSDVEEFFNKKFKQAVSGSVPVNWDSAGEQLPVFISYDFICSIYPDLGIRKSGWPLAAALVPEAIYSGRFDRQESKNEVGIRSVSVNDGDLEKRIDATRNRIYNGEALQVVISKRFDLERIDPFTLLNYFMEADHSLYVYYYRFGNFEIIGSSPENVISMDGRDLEINPIAETRPRGRDSAEEKILSESLLNDEKKLMEHSMLVDLARNTLA